MAPHYEQTRDAANAALLADLSTLLRSEKHTDLKIKLGDYIWNVHKAIVCARSDFFAKACEGKFKEANDGVVEIHDDNPTVIDKMIHYIYKTEYEDADTELAPVLLNVRIVAAAEKYFVKFLAPLAVSKLNYHVEDSWETEAFADAIAEAYTTTHDSDRELRDTLLKVVVEHAHELFDKVKTQYAHFQEMAAKTPSFSMEIAASLAKIAKEYEDEKEHEDKLTYWCPGDPCRERFMSSVKERQILEWSCGICGWSQGPASYEFWQEYAATELPVVEPTDDD
ncbi:hypothetical protein LTR17_019571 [Elasticomyces elasticus]|nr:hypothetical protein LTR17_019571 [Elasticomyces elasticus]